MPDDRAKAVAVEVLELCQQDRTIDVKDIEDIIRRHIAPLVEAAKAMEAVERLAGNGPRASDGYGLSVHRTSSGRYVASCGNRISSGEPTAAAAILSLAEKIGGGNA